jgi:acyl carrier protein
MSPTEADVLAAIREIAAGELQLTRPISPSHELVADLELDSMSLVALLASVENRFRVALPRADSGILRTVGDIVDGVIEGCRERPS